MKKISLLSIFALLILSSCCDNKVINGVKHRPYGLLNPEEKVDSIQYRIPAAPFIAGIFFAEMIAPPIYIFGYNMYEPVGIKQKN